MALTDDLISHWSLEEASGTRGDDHGSNSLAEENAVTVNSATGKVNNGAGFVTASFTGLGKADGTWLDAITTKASLQMWIKTSDGGQDKDPGGIRESLEMQQVGGYIQIQTSNVTNAYAGSVFATDTWAHIVVVYDGDGASNTDKLKVYFNGSALSLSYTGSLPSSIVTSPGVHLGSNGNASDWWSGVLDQVGLWSRCLTTDEITFLYNSGAGRTYAEIAGSPPAVSDYRIIPPTLNFIQPAGQLAIVPATA